MIKLVCVTVCLTSLYVNFNRLDRCLQEAKSVSSTFFKFLSNRDFLGMLTCWHSICVWNEWIGLLR